MADFDGLAQVTLAAPLASAARVRSARYNLPFSVVAGTKAENQSSWMSLMVSVASSPARIPEFPAGLRGFHDQWLQHLQPQQPGLVLQ